MIPASGNNQQRHATITPIANDLVLKDQTCREIPRKTKGVNMCDMMLLYSSAIPLVSSEIRMVDKE